MGNINTKYYISNFEYDFTKQGRVSKSFDNILKNASHKRCKYLTLRKASLMCEIVLDGSTGIPLCRLSFPKQMGNMILNEEISFDMENIYKTTDELVKHFIKSRFPHKSEYSYQLQINNN